MRSVDIPHVGGEVSPDGAVVAVADGRDVVLLDAATLSEQRVLEGHAALTTLQFSRDGTRFASGYEDGTVIVWDVATGTVQDRFDGHAGGVMELAFSPDGATLYTVSLDRSLLAWDLDGSRRFVAISQAPATPGNADYAIVVPTGDQVTYVGGLYGTPDAMQFLDLADNHMSPVIEVGHGGIGDVRGRPPAYGEVATSGRDRMVRVWDRDTGRLLREHDVDGERIAYSADGERIVVGSGEGSDHGDRRRHARTRSRAGPPRPWRAADLRRSRQPHSDRPDRRTGHRPHRHRRPPRAARTRHRVRSDLGRLLPRRRAGGRRHQHRRGRRPRRRHRRLGPPAGGGSPRHRHHRRLRARREHTRQWRASTGESRCGTDTPELALGTIVASQNVATGARFAPDGHTVVIASTDGTVARWDTRVEQWIATACTIAGRSLTPTEWADILADRTYIDTCQ